MTHFTTTETKMTIGIDQCEAGRKNKRGFRRSSSAASAVHVTHADAPYWSQPTAKPRDPVPTMPVVASSPPLVLLPVQMRLMACAPGTSGDL
jgi:hypothetical protein